MHGTQIDIALSPAQAMLGELLAHVRRGDVQAVHSLRRGVAEALDIVARGDRKARVWWAAGWMSCACLRK
jgi:trk system potassium uptake protein TrkA